MHHRGVIDTTVGGPIFTASILQRLFPFLIGERDQRFILEAVTPVWHVRVHGIAWDGMHNVLKPVRNGDSNGPCAPLACWRLAYPRSQRNATLFSKWA